MLRKHVIQKYAHLTQIDHVIGHDNSVFFKGALQARGSLFLLFVIYAIVDQYTTFSYLGRIFGAAGVILFVKYILQFLNQYLDCIILGPQGVTIFQREGLMEYKTDIFNRENIETVHHNQNSVRDKLRSRGDIHITLDHSISFPFENIAKPRNQVNTIIRYRDQYRNPQIQTPATNTDQYAILMEALGEVAQEYLQKKREQSTEQEDSFDY